MHRSTLVQENGCRHRRRINAITHAARMKERKINRRASHPAIPLYDASVTLEIPWWNGNASWIRGARLSARRRIRTRPHGTGAHHRHDVMLADTHSTAPKPPPDPGTWCALPGPTWRRRRFLASRLPSARCRSEEGPSRARGQAGGSWPANTPQVPMPLRFDRQPSSHKQGPTDTKSRNVSFSLSVKSVSYLVVFFSHNKLVNTFEVLVDLPLFPSSTQQSAIWLIDSGPPPRTGSILGLDITWKKECQNFRANGKDLNFLHVLIYERHNNSSISLLIGGINRE
jgi:hypothetical protein